MTIKNVVSENEPQAFEKCIDIEHGETDCEVRGGPLLEELFHNLVENSILHSNCDRIRISSKENEEECIVTIEDDGKEISEEDKDKIFGRGYKKGETGGSGLGLFLVKEIAESYGGNIQVKNSKLGGVRFDVRLKKS
ncbi:hypothetical protein AKJ51_05225 [candidate division MSBL1 archaeon SCGC-AAA382A20]|uniref:histidine kinase n=1 Tax=candidate division MSBL1 archaeon SCGC-AAA382A20 TaxID=1698280 RepID=A0A133VFL6_9EURY|nr:hypothetical protein AKJ51_05225 [candidate division MSBL1 archaeon SCGC-AAA382A20]